VKIRFSSPAWRVAVRVAVAWVAPGKQAVLAKTSRRFDQAVAKILVNRRASLESLLIQKQSAGV